MSVDCASLRIPGRFPAPSSWTQQSCASQTDVKRCVDAVLKLMQQHPFSTSDVLAVQVSVREALEGALSDPRSGCLGEAAPVRFQYRVEPDHVWVAIRGESGASSTDRPQKPGPHALSRIYMTDVAVNPEENSLLLHRHRGHGAASLPHGYDFQI
ncbi:hypothetical protein [Planctomicrobium sp. SH664]|uniref:hypothetical protein n=1 Tax=Planctomicrobium sp. SH664 TaxID=3448125 RepID=UPI003F5C71EF